ncbi:MAG TPA: hypothetical protein VMD78_16310 [Candidatus Baltobacteraceae bacterium]|nr:hypothetical protein [Candidatus Baltobacteraceae bacterium]
MRIAARRLGLYWAASLAVASAGLGQQTGPTTREYPTPTIREEQRVVVDGIPETWRLEWAAAPAVKPACDASDAGSWTCPCMGFAYGESGDLYLTRIRDGVEVDRLHLTPLFGNERNQVATVQRWPVYDLDFDNQGSPRLADDVSQRPAVRVMHFADYDHDGHATEFYMETESGPCGKNTGVVVGVSSDNPKLHALGTASHPDAPLYLHKMEWEALRAATAAVEVEDWACGDHGSPTETKDELYWTGRGIEGVRREYSCPAAGESRSLLDQKPL